MGLKDDLFPGEEFVKGLEADTLVLTTKRVRCDSILVGKSAYMSITLDSVASCGLTTISKPLLLFLGAVALLFAFSQGNNDVRALFIGAAFILGLAYLITRRKVISIASNGGESILASAGGVSRSSIIDFFGAVEQEKLRRESA